MTAESLDLEALIACLRECWGKNATGTWCHKPKNLAIALAGEAGELLRSWW